MAGLLDFLGSDEAKLGLGLLAAGGPSATPLSTWQRVQGTMQGMEADKANKLRLGLLQSQVDENQGQAALRQQQLALLQRQQALKERFYGGLLGAAPAGGAPGALSGGVSGTSPAGAVPASSGPEAVAMSAQAINKRYGIPVEALVSDMMFNDGKNIPEMIAKRGTPDMQVSGNYAYDKNSLQPGYLPSLNISQDGKSSLVQIGPDGQPVVSAPRGALSTYNAYTDAGNRSAAAYKEGTPTIGPDGRKVIGSVLSNVMPAASGARAGYATEPEMRTTVAGDMGANPAAIQRELKQVDNDLMKPLDDSSRAALKDYKASLQRQAANVGVKPMAGNVVELSPAEQTANKAAEVRAVDTAKADVTRDTGKQTQGKSASQALETVQRARELLQAGPTASGVGRMADTAMNFFGQNTKGAETSAALDVVAGDLLRSIPRMEGPQSDKDVENYKIQAGRVSDRDTPVPQRLAALKEVERLNLKYASQNGGVSNTGGATGSFGEPEKPQAKAPKLLDELPAANVSIKGQRIRDTTTGKVLVFDGMTWKAQ